MFYPYGVISVYLTNFCLEWNYIYYYYYYYFDYYYLLFEDDEFYDYHANDDYSYFIYNYFRNNLASITLVIFNN